VDGAFSQSQDYWDGGQKAHTGGDQKDHMRGDQKDHKKGPLGPCAELSKPLKIRWSRLNGVGSLPDEVGS
jgi:hypothetical protein